MIQRYFYHNIIFNDEQVSPYNEVRYLGIITTYISENSVASEENLTKE